MSWNAKRGSNGFYTTVFIDIAINMRDDTEGQLTLLGTGSAPND